MTVLVSGEPSDTAYVEASTRSEDSAGTASVEISASTGTSTKSKDSAGTASVESSTQSDDYAGTAFAGTSTRSEDYAAAASTETSNLIILTGNGKKPLAGAYFDLGCIRPLARFMAMQHNAQPSPKFCTKMAFCNIRRVDTG